MFEKYFMTKAMERLQKGKTANLSPAQIAELNLDMEKAKSNLPPEQFYMVLDLFKEYKSKTYKITYEIKGYEKAVADMFFDFDFLGNVKCYAKDSKISAFWVENEDKERLRDRANETRTQLKQIRNQYKQSQELYDKFKGCDLNKLQEYADKGILPKDETEVLISSLLLHNFDAESTLMLINGLENELTTFKNKFYNLNKFYNTI